MHSAAVSVLPLLGAAVLVLLLTFGFQPMTVWSGTDKLLNLIADPMSKMKGAGPKQISSGITKHLRTLLEYNQERNCLNPGEKKGHL